MELLFWPGFGLTLRRSPEKPLPCRRWLARHYLGVGVNSFKMWCGEGDLNPHEIAPASTSTQTSEFHLVSLWRKLLDLESDFLQAVSYIAQALGFGSPSTPGGFSLPAPTQQEAAYIARFYSGGLADSGELSNILDSDYTKMQFDLRKSVTSTPSLISGSKVCQSHSAAVPMILSH